MPLTAWYTTLPNGEPDPTALAEGEAEIDLDMIEDAMESGEAEAPEGSLEEAPRKSLKQQSLKQQSLKQQSQKQRTHRNQTQLRRRLLPSSLTAAQTRHGSLQYSSAPSP